MILLQETRVIDRSLEDCFRYLADFSTIEQWDPGVYRAEKVTPGAPRVGSEFDLILNSAGQRVPMRYRLTEMQSSRVLVLEGNGAAVHALDTIRFEPHGENQTRIDYTAELTFKGVGARFEFGLRPWLNRVGRAAVDGMKRCLEIEDGFAEEGMKDRLKAKLVLPAAWDFTDQGYLSMPNKGLSEYMDGKTVVITGPTSGLGFAAACELSRLGAKLALVGRDRPRLDEAARKIRDYSGAKPGTIRLFEAELSLKSELERVGKEIAAACPKIDALIHNAGALFQSRVETVEGHERTFAIHLLAPWMLTEKLKPQLQAARGRLILVSSGGMYTQRLRVDDLESREVVFDGVKAYARMKRAQVLLGEYWAKAFSSTGVSVFTMHPGWAATPGVAQSLPTFERVLRGRLRDARMGADTIVWLASHAGLQEGSGRFWLDRKPRPTELLWGTRGAGNDTQKLLDYLSICAGPAFASSSGVESES